LQSLVGGAGLEPAAYRVWAGRSAAELIALGFRTPGRTRTCNALLRRQQLYPLSYRGLIR
jgi:hypothetical protein